MVNLQKKISSLMDGFRHFTSNNFDFKTVNFQLMEEELNDDDKMTFFCDMNKVMYPIFLNNCLDELIINILLTGSFVALH